MTIVYMNSTGSQLLKMDFYDDFRT